MPGYNVSQLSIINQIKNNLQDRYSTGFPILKELLQNADDSKARRFRLDALPGWPSASNPLLQGPGLLVVNDGVFRKEDGDGIMSFGVSGKASDEAAIGKFGFGQKAVFHLCDAFIVYAYGKNCPFNKVVNPFLGIKAKDNICHTWEPPNDGDLSKADLQSLLMAGGSDFQNRGLIFWVPFRREDLMPAPDLAFLKNLPSPSTTIDELNKTSELRVLLATLRYIEFIEIRENGTKTCSINVKEAYGRMLGPDRWKKGIRQFGGLIESKADQSNCKFLAREVVTLDRELVKLKQSKHWPTNWDALSLESIPEKGQQHGAAMLLRDSTCSHSKLKITWAVFLPISDDFDVDISVNSATLGEMRLLLHGYFFLDSGRRMIEGLKKSYQADEPQDASALRESWNTKLRDSAVLPLVPLVLLDALDSRMISRTELLELVRSVALSNLFVEHRRSICQKNSLVRILRKSSGAVWQLVPHGTKMYPLPSILEDSSNRIEELLPSIHTWAKSRDAHFVVDKNSALLFESIGWEAEGLDTIFSGLSPRAFQSRKISKLLVEFLQVAVSGDTERTTIGPHLVSGFRKAMLETTPFAEAELIKSILMYVPYELLLPLPPSVENRQLLHALASTQCDVLPVRRVWIDELSHSPQLSISNLKMLLESMQAHIDGKNSDQAAIVTLSLLRNAEFDLTILSDDPEVGPLKVLRARDVRASGSIALSLTELVDRSRSGVLFAASVNANRLLPTLAEALLDQDVFVVEVGAATYLKESGGSSLLLHAAGNAAAYALINDTSRFGSEEDRLMLLKELERIDGNEGGDRTALRCLCAGDRVAGQSNSKLWMLERADSGIERIVAEILSRREGVFLVPASLVDELKPRTRKYIGIDVLDSDNLEDLLENNLDKVENLKPTPEEREALLKCDLSDSLLQKLPVHTRMNGSVGNAFEVFRIVRGWQIPKSLLRMVTIIKLCNDSKARERQERLILKWSPVSQIAIAIAQPEPHRLRGDILNALANVTRKEELDHQISNIRAMPWLLAGSKPIPPEKILTLPRSINEAAQRTLVKDGKTPPFMFDQELAVDIREHASLKRLNTWILPGQDESLAMLKLAIKDQEIVARLGPSDMFPVDDYTALAKDGSDLRLPGWPLLSAVLRSKEIHKAEDLKIVAAFFELEEADTILAANHLDSLAELVAEKGAKGKSAQRAHFFCFKIIANWSEEAQRAIFSNCHVPTRSGQWRCGCEVIDSGGGVDPNYVLAEDYARLLTTKERMTAQISNVESGPNDRDSSPDHHADLDAESAEQQRLFLSAWRDRIPCDLVIVYLGLVGRSKPFKQLAREWSTNTTSDVEALWEELDNHFPDEILHPNSLPEEVDQFRYLIEQIDAESVDARAMSGDSINVPLGKGQGSLILGNSHKSPERIRGEDGKQRLLVKFKIRKVDLSRCDHWEARRKLREFIETVAADFLFGMEKQQSALNDVLDKRDNVDKSTIKEVERHLRTDLPMRLAGLKLPTDSRAQIALRAYQDNWERLDRFSAPAQDFEQLGIELWSSIMKPEVSNELLDAVRSKIQEFGYSANRVLFELFQNADDAYTQMDDTDSNGCLRIETFSEDTDGVRIIHWGRPINHLGLEKERGRRCGYHKDLLNMLLMNLSEKRGEENLTGKFGLGFKSVHILSENVGIASGFNISLRTCGGFVLSEWSEGIDLVQARTRLAGRKATIIDIPFSALTKEDGEEAVNAFRTSAAWVSAFSQAIRIIEIADEDPVKIECSTAPLLGESKIKVVRISGPYSAQCLRFDLLDGYSLLLMFDVNGPCSFPKELMRLWNLTPLEEDLPSGWLLNGPFNVDPGRTRLAGLVEGRHTKFRELGVSLGNQLIELYLLTESDWPNFANDLNLDASENDAKTLFWTQLFQLFQLDFKDNLALKLHADSGGYGHLAGKYSVVPTHLPQPFNGLVCALDVDHFTDVSLSDPDILQKVQDWRVLTSLTGRTVASGVAGLLEILGFNDIHPITIVDLLRDEVGTGGRVDVRLAEKLGCVFTDNAVRQEPLILEQGKILETVKQVKFLAEDGSWRSAQDISSKYASSDDERLRCGFAPDGALLNKDYQGAALEFFKLARLQSGYSPNVALLLGWADNADSPDRQCAVLRYIIDGRQGWELAKAMRSALPAWVPQPLQRLFNDQLLHKWCPEEKMRLLSSLGGTSVIDVIPEIQSENRLMADPQTILSSIHEWWLKDGTEQTNMYMKRVYPTSFSPALLCEGRDRIAWFTMFALACFRSLGRTQDQQHRSFIEYGYSEGWWQDLAESKPPGDVEPWIKRLESWSESTQFDQSFHLWRRMFVDLYTVARWLDEYIELVVKLPRVIEDLGSISLREALQPSFFTPIELDAAPVNKSLGIGMNWMIREMLRQGAYQKKDSKFLAPYCWASSQRVRDLLNPMGANIGAWADKDASRAIHEFIVEHLDDDRARFAGDFDLPLQLITRGNNRDVLEGCFESADSAPPVIGDTGEDV